MTGSDSVSSGRLGNGTELLLPASVTDSDGELFNLVLCDVRPFSFLGNTSAENSPVDSPICDSSAEPEPKSWSWCTGGRSGNCTELSPPTFGTDGDGKLFNLVLCDIGLLPFFGDTSASTVQRKKKIEI